MDLHFDCETQDPDDILTLAIAATHPEVNLIGVTVTPGGKDQVGLVEHVLLLLGYQPYSCQKMCVMESVGTKHFTLE